MNTKPICCIHPSSPVPSFTPEGLGQPQPQLSPLKQWLQDELSAKVGTKSASVISVSTRIAKEVGRVCEKSKRIKTSGDIRSWQESLGRHRINKCLSYYQLGSQQGRKELHSNLSVMIYRHIAPAKAQLGFAGRYSLMEDFLQDFYTESLKAFRRENEVTQDYQPRTRLELAEYMSFTEQYAKRRITLPNGFSQQLVILRAQTFARRQPKETSVDIEQAIEFPKGEDAQSQNRSSTVQQVRNQMIAETIDPSEAVLRDRVINELLEYLENQGHSDCANYLTLKLQDLPASEIDEILGLTSRERDYLQQRFKYHMEKFARTSHWKLVHQWLGADLDAKLGLTGEQWNQFVGQLSPQQKQILQLKQEKVADTAIAKEVGLTAKRLQKQWTKLIDLAWEIRND